VLFTHLENLKTEHPIQDPLSPRQSLPARQRTIRFVRLCFARPESFYETVARLTALLGPDRVGIRPSNQPGVPMHFKCSRLILISVTYSHDFARESRVSNAN